MPHYFFDVREGVRFVEDEDGIELPDIELRSGKRQSQLQASDVICFRKAAPDRSPSRFGTNTANA